VSFSSIFFDAQDVLASSFCHTSDAPNKCMNRQVYCDREELRGRSGRRQPASPARPPLNPTVILYLLLSHHDQADRASKASHLCPLTPLFLEFGETPSRLCRQPRAISWPGLFLPPAQPSSPYALVDGLPATKIAVRTPPNIRAKQE